MSVAKSYLAGVILGDGWCTRLTLGLRVADEDFALAFVGAIADAFNETVRCKRDERGYWLARIGNKTGRFNSLIDYEPANLEEVASWLRGMFDSEGNAQLGKAKISANSWNRRVSLYSTNAITIERSATYLHRLGIATVTYRENPSRGHKGQKLVLQLRIKPGRENFRKFAEIVGSSISRKNEVLLRIPETYQPPGHHARAQALGVDIRWPNRKHKTEE